MGSRKGFRILCIVIGLSMLFMAFTSPVSKNVEAQADEEMVLRVGMQADVTTFNPTVASDVWSWKMLS